MSNMDEEFSKLLAGQAQYEQSQEALQRFAIFISAYYHELVSHGVPSDIAYGLTLHFQMQMLQR